MDSDVAGSNNPGSANGDDSPPEQGTQNPGAGGTVPVDGDEDPGPSDTMPGTGSTNPGPGGD